MGHLKRGHRLGEEIPRAMDKIACRLAVKDPFQCLLMHANHVEDALSLAKRTSPEFVSLLKGRFAALAQVCLQRPFVINLQPVHREPPSASQSNVLREPERRRCPGRSSSEACLRLLARTPVSDHL